MSCRVSFHFGLQPSEKISIDALTLQMNNRPGEVKRLIGITHPENGRVEIQTWVYLIPEAIFFPDNQLPLSGSNCKAPRSSPI